jgi:hypothetical protein
MTLFTAHHARTLQTDRIVSEVLAQVEDRCRTFDGTSMLISVHSRQAERIATALGLLGYTVFIRSSILDDKLEINW